MEHTPEKLRSSVSGPYTEISLTKYYETEEKKLESDQHGIQGADSLLVETRTHLGAFTQSPRAK